MLMKRVALLLCIASGAAAVIASAQTVVEVYRGSDPTPELGFLVEFEHRGDLSILRFSPDSIFRDGFDP